MVSRVWRGPITADTRMKLLVCYCVSRDQLRKSRVLKLDAAAAGRQIVQKQQKCFSEETMWLLAREQALQRTYSTQPAAYFN